MLITDRIKESYHPPMAWAEKTAIATLVLEVLAIIVSIWAAIKSARTQKKLDKLQAEREEARREAARVESRTSQRGTSRSESLPVHGFSCLYNGTISTNVRTTSNRT
jgi:hypothetical protein